jgi:DNA-directed RNA polymerase specialized sigma24 family protein
LSAQLTKPEFKGLQARLLAYCIRVFFELGIGGADTIISGAALSPEEFVGKVLADYALGNIKHHSAKGSLLTVLCTALRNDVIDALRRKSHRSERPWSAQKDEGTEGKKPKNLADTPDDTLPDIPVALDEEAYKQRVRKALSAELDLVEVVDAVFEFNASKPEEIAEVLGITATEVQNRKKRLRRRLITHGLVLAREKKAGSE